MALLGVHIAVEVIFWAAGGITSLLFLSLGVEEMRYDYDDILGRPSIPPQSFFQKQYALLAFTALLTLSISEAIKLLSLC